MNRKTLSGSIFATPPRATRSKSSGSGGDADPDRFTDSDLLKGDVFSKDQIDAYCEVKWEEVMRWETTPSPVEFDMYYSG